MCVDMKRDEGFGVVMALGVAFVVFVLGATWYALAVHEIDEVGFDRHRRVSVNAAEAGLRETMYFLSQDVVAYGNVDGAKTLADGAGFDFGVDGGGNCEIATLTDAEGNTTGEYWARATNTGTDRYLIEAWGFGPFVGSRQEVEKKVELEVNLIPYASGFTHALFAADGGLQAGNRKEIYGDGYSGEDMVVGNYTRLFPNDAGYSGNGDLIVNGDLSITSGANPDFSGNVYVDGYIDDRKSGTIYQGDVVTRYDNALSALTKSYFKNATVNGTVYVGGASLKAGSKINGATSGWANVTFNSNAFEDFPSVALPQFEWDAGDYTGSIGVPSIAEIGDDVWPDWNSFQDWVDDNEDDLHGAHYVMGGGTLDLNGTTMTDDFLVATSGSLIITKSPAVDADADLPLLIMTIVDDDADTLEFSLGVSSIAGQLHHLGVSEGNLKVSQQTTIYGTLYGKTDVSTNRLEIHFRPPPDDLVPGFSFDPTLVDYYVPEPLAFREVPADDPVPITSYCTP